MNLVEVLGAGPPRIVSLPPSATALEAATLMNAEGVGCIVVIDDIGRLVGVLSERDLAVAIATRGARLFRSPISALAPVAGPIARLDDDVRGVMRVMTTRRARHIPVLEGETVVGVVSLGDLLKLRLDETRETLAPSHLAPTPTARGRVGAT